MSRSTQFIGLNSFARDFVKNAKRKEHYPMTHGMFGEDIYGTIYYLDPKFPGKWCWILKEVVQTMPWSSGPMIFTRFHLTVREIEGRRKSSDMGLIFTWMEDPSLAESEFDYETGRYWV